jgi:hypothetical protein
MIIQLKTANMKKAISSSLVILVLFFLTASVSSAQSKQTRDVAGFREVGFGIAGNLYITIGPSFKVTLEGDADYLSDIETVVRDGKLHIRKDNNWGFSSKKADIYITMPSLAGLTISGSGKAKIESSVEADAFNVSVSGSGRLYIADLTADTFGCSISGSGDVIVEGKGGADSGKITISGSGNYSGEGFEIDNLTVNISGSGKCDCKAGDSLKASISGSGNVYYSGQPKLDVRASGSGHVRSK